METNEQIKKLFSDDSFSKEFSETKSIKEAVELFARHGVKVTESDIQSFFSEPKGELSDESLDSVAGGAIRSPLDWMKGPGNILPLQQRKDWLNKILKK